MRSFNLNTASGILAVVLWSTTLTIARDLSEQLGPLTAAAYSCMAGSIFCLASFIWRQNPVRRYKTLSLKYLLVCGFLFISYETLIFLAVGLAKNHPQLLQVTLINYLWPTGTILLSLPLLKKQANFLILPGTVMAILGVIIAISNDSNLAHIISNIHSWGSSTACLFALLAAFVWALYSTLTSRWSTTENYGAVDIFIPLTAIALLFLRNMRTESTTWSARALIESIILGGISALAYILWERSMRKGNVIFIAACSYLTPILSLLFSCAYLRIWPSYQLWVAAALIVVGSMVSWRAVSDL